MDTIEVYFAKKDALKRELLTLQRREELFSPE